MEKHPLHPLEREASWFEAYCKLPVHTGVATIGSEQEAHDPFTDAFREMHRRFHPEAKKLADVEFRAAFVVPAGGGCRIFLRNSVGFRLNRVFGDDLRVCGECPDGPFEFECPHFYVDVTSSSSDDPSWAILSPVNCFAHVSYGPSRRIAKVLTTINNFDFEHGNVPATHGAQQSRHTLRVEASGRTVDFTWREGHEQLRHLLDIEMLRSGALVSFSFAAWEGATESDLADFANNVASLCSIVAWQHTGVPVLSFVDQEGRVIKRRLGNAIESDFSNNNVLRFLHFDEGLPKLFRQCFDEHVKLQKSDLWRTIPALCAGINDPPFLEQKITTLMGGVEQVIRNSLIEATHWSREEAARKTFSDLIRPARRVLKWDILPHYTAKNRHLLLRNTVAHGGALPGESGAVRAEFDKWQLFLVRRLLIRLGFDGKVLSPQRGWASESSVNDFSEEHNSFQT